MSLIEKVMTACQNTQMVWRELLMLTMDRILFKIEMLPPKDIIHLKFESAEDSFLELLLNDQPIESLKLLCLCYVSDMSGPDLLSMIISLS